MKSRKKIDLCTPDNLTYFLLCVECDNATEHKVLASAEWSEANDILVYWEEYQIVQCLGCKALSFRSNSRCTEDEEWDYKEQEMKLANHEKLYPGRTAGRKELNPQHYLPAKVSSIYIETHFAICNTQNILAGVGIRALVEAVCNEKKADGKTLEKKIDDLVRQSILTPPGAEFLHKTRLMGNKAAHEVKAASIEHLNIAMDIVENLLMNVYILPRTVQKIQE